MAVEVSVDGDCVVRVDVNVMVHWVLVMGEDVDFACVDDGVFWMITTSSRDWQKT